MKVRKLFWIIFILFSFLCLTFVSCGKQNKKVSIGFCEFPEQYKEVIVELLSKNADISFICNDIDFLNLQSNPEKACKKYDLIFTKNGEVSSLIEKYANSISQTVLSLEPESLQKNAKNSLPLFIDHYGISYSQIVKQEAGISYPASYNQFKIYLENVKEFSSVPLFIEGSNDDVLLAFIGALVESFSGSEGYFNFLEGLKSCSSVEELLLTKISNEYTVDSIFKEIVELQQKDFLNKGWIKNKKTDFENFSNDNRIAAAFLSLSDFHELSYSVASKYVCDRVPVKNGSLKHGLIAPEYVVFNTNKNNKANESIEEIMMFLLSDSVQKQLSKQTKLAPASSTAQAYDQQADDVRYLAAACINGPVPLPSDFLLDNRKLHSIAENIRLYFKAIN